jgi:hypothetical protein
MSSFGSMMDDLDSDVIEAGECATHAIALDRADSIAGDVAARGRMPSVAFQSAAHTVHAHG